MKKRILAVMLSVALVFSSFGLAFAEETGNEEVVKTYSDYMLKKLVNVMHIILQIIIIMA